MIALSDLNWNTILDDIDKDPTLKPLDTGKYTAVVESADAVTAGSGNLMITVRMRVTVGPREGSKAMTNIVFAVGNPKAMNFTKRKLAGLGIDDAYLREHNPGTAAIAAAIVGVVAEIDVVQRDSEEWGKQADIKGFTKVGAGPKSGGGAPGPKAGVPNIGPGAATKPKLAPVPQPEPEPVAVEPEPEPELDDEGDPF